MDTIRGWEGIDQVATIYGRHAVEGRMGPIFRQQSDASKANLECHPGVLEGGRTVSRARLDTAHGRPERHGRSGRGR